MSLATLLSERGWGGDGWWGVGILREGGTASGIGMGFEVAEWGWLVDVQQSIEPSCCQEYLACLVDCVCVCVTLITSGYRLRGS